jgi:hypothetical protein
MSANQAAKVAELARDMARGYAAHITASRMAPRIDRNAFLKLIGAYFDHAPELELVYHLRNCIAHGNRFKYTDVGRKRLAKHPAHNRNAGFRTSTIFEITPALNGQLVLFDFMEAGDVLDLLFSVAQSFG